METSAQATALEEAKRNATRGALPRIKPLGFGCAVFVVITTCAGVTFAIGLVAAICAHRWGLS